MVETMTPPAPPALAREAAALSPTERHLLFHEWCDTARDYPLVPLIHELVAERARRDPAAVAVADGGRRITYGELDARANGLARRLHELGVGPEKRVAILAGRSIELVLGALAVLKAGGCYVPVDPRFPQERRTFMLEDSRAAAVLVHPDQAAELAAGAVPVIRLDVAETLEAAASPPSAVGPENLAYVIYTSGSTGRPKGAEVGHASLIRLIRWHLETYGFAPGDRATLFSGPSFDVSVWEVWSCLAAGAGLHIPDEDCRASAPRMIQWLAREEITHGVVSTPLAELMIGEPWPSGVALRTLTTGGDRLHQWPGEGFPCPIYNIYGPTEGTVVTTCFVLRPGAALEGVLPPIGRPLANIRVYVLDPDYRPLPPGESGELWIGGGGLGRGYLERPELTAEKFVPDPFAGEPGARLYRTGDLARYLPDGNLEFLGRIDFQIKIRGFRIEPGEIEAELVTLPGVREAAVLPHDGGPGGTRLVAYLAAAGLARETAGVRESLGVRLPEYMVPAAFVWLDALPLTPNGKVDRRALAAIPVEFAAATLYVAPRTATERVLAEIWAEVLGVERVGIRDPFLHLGGHSLLAVQVLARLRRRLGADLPVRAMFDAPTVEELAAVVERELPEGSAEPGLVPRRGERELPFSFAQQRLWFLDRLQPGSALYNVPAAYRLRGELRPAALAAALEEITRRHEALRTRFGEGENGPVQLIEPAAAFPLPEVDLAGLPAAARAAEEARLARAAAVLPFDLARGPLLRALLLRVAPGDWVLVLVIHHIVSDGWSMGVLARELDTLYGAALAGLPSPLPELPVQYADYALWQHERLRGAALEEDLAYWRERLAGHPPALELPADRPRPAARSLRGASEPFRLGPEVAERLRALSRESGAPLFVPLLAGFLTLLHRYTGQTDLLVGTPTAGRGRVELEGLIGFFVNTLVLRASLAGDPSFRELVERARETALGAYTHAELPFERLVEELAPERAPGRLPLIEVMLSLQDAAGAPALAGLEVEELALSTGTAKLDLTLVLGETADGGIAGELEHDRDLFDAATARRMLGHLEILLAGAAADPAARLSGLPLLAPAERRTLLVDWNATAAPFPGERSIHGLFAERARQTPAAPAVIAGEERIAYGELDARAAALAARLRAAGVGPETLVALCAERSIEWVVAMLAILKAGGAYVPLDPTYPRERLAFLLADTAAPVLLAQERLAATLPAGDARLVLLDGEAGAAAATPPLDEVGGDHLAYVIYTSGSTGKPKGVAVPHRAVLRLVLGTDYLELGPGDRLSQVANASFDAATFEVWGPLLNGGSLVIFPQEVVLSPAALAAELRRHGVRTTFLTTALFNQMAREAPGALASAREVLFGGEAADPEAVRAVLRDGPPRRLLHVYGPTENTTFSTWLEVETLAAAATAVPIGRPVANSTAYVLDAFLRPVPLGVRGSLYVGGEGLARGYLGRPELTAERFVPSPFGAPGERLYATGDLVRQLVDGSIEFLGRADHQVKIRGFRIELGEIEVALTGHPAVAEAAVLAPGDGAGRRLVAYLTPSGEAPAATEIREHLRSRLPDYMVPPAFVWLESLPLTPNGKIDRAALARLEVRPEPAGHVAPRTGTEQALAEVWAELLDVERIGAHDDFFHLGGHSLLAVRVLSRVRRLFGVEVPVRALFEAPTVEALAHAVERALGGSGREAGMALPERPAELPLSFSQQRLWFLDRLQPGSSSYNMPMAYRLRGRLAPAALAGALGEIVRRHEALRTRFAERAAGAVQVIDPSPPPALPRVDLEGLPEPLRAAEESRLLWEEALRPFDLARGPLLRPLLLRLAAGDWVLMLSMHHIVSDGWSMGVMLRELGALYDALLAGEPPPLPELPLQYADFALWQRRWLQGEALERPLSYWREQLAGHPPALELPADRPRPAVPALRGGTVPVVLERELSARLLAAGRRQGVSLFMTTLAGFLALLHRYTGQTDLVVGTPAAGRSRVELEGLIGFFINTLALRVDAAGDPAFAELLGRARETALEAYAHAELPLERIVEELAPERSLSHSPLFQVIFELQTAPLEMPRISGIEIAELPLSNGAAKLDLSLILAETPEGTLAGDLEYDRELFDAATVQRMAGHLRILLAGAVDRPDVPLSGLPLLSAAERAELLEWNDTARNYFAASLWEPVHEMLAAHARRAPEALAVVAGEQRLTYGELDARSNRLAHELRALGVGPDVVVGVCAERTLERVVGIAAVLKAGGAYASFDPDYPRERLALAMEDARVPVLLTESRLLDRVPAATTMVICLDRDLERLEGDGLRPPAVAVDPDHLAYVIFTSGSTGRPKGVAVPHRGLANLVRWHHETYGVTPEDVGTQVASPAFDVAVWELWPLLAAGAAQSIPDREIRLSPHRMVSWWKEAGITLAFLPTPLADGILSEEMPADLPVRYLVVGGDRLHRSPRPGTSFQLSNIYGPAEHSVVTTMAIVPPGGRVTIGRALANTRVHVLDAHGTPVPSGVPGELHVAGSGLARGYLWRPELTAERFLPDPFGAPGGRMYRTGDLVRRLPDGDLEFLGRLDHQVKIRGIRVELGEIESVLGRHPGVREAVVMVPEGRLTAYVAGLAGEAPPAGELRGFLEARLPAYMVPQDWALLAAMPLTPNGKIDRQALARIEVARTAPGGEDGYVAPRTDAEARLAELWAELLGVARVGVHDNFFALGGHSLLAIQAVSRARRLFAVELELRDLFNDATVEGLARAIARSPSAEAGPGAVPAPAAGSPEGELPLSFAQQRLWFLERLRPGTAAYNMPMAYRLRARVRPQAMAAALGEVVRRHAALRARFLEGETGPVQVIAAAAGFRLPWIDLTGLPEPSREGERERLTTAEAARPFDLERGPLLRPFLLALAAGDWVLMLSLHHIVSDGWSMEVLLRELDALYGAALDERPSPLPELPMQYTGFAIWQRGWLQGRLLEDRLAYWRHRLAGHPPLLELPADHPRPAAPSFRAAAEPLAVDAELTGRLRELSRRSGTPLFVVLLSGFVTLLHRYTGQTDLLIGTPTAGRGRVELEGLIGFFVNTLVLRTDATGDPPYLELLSRAREASLGDYVHADLPFERLVEELAPERDLGRSPLLQAMLSLQSATGGAPRLAGVEVEELGLTLPVAKFDLTVGLVETGRGMAGEIVYARDLFEAATVRRLGRHLESLLAGIAADPAARLSELPLLSPAERLSLLVEWNATVAPFPGERSIHGLFAERARQAPAAVAVIAGAERITYGELDARADALAARLRAAGVGPETLVALCAERAIEWVVATLAVLKAGGAYVPLNPTYPRERLALLLADTAAPVLLTQERLAPALPAGGARVILLDGEAGAAPAMPPLGEGGGDHLAYVIYTSGSTGRPKGVAVPHRAVLRLVLNTDYVQFSPGDCLAQAANASFDAATFELWGPLLNGGSVAIFPREAVLSPTALATDLRRHGARVMFLTTALLNQVAREAPGAFAALDALLFGGEAADPEAVRAVLREGPPRRLVHVYGPTENTTYSTWLEVGRLAETAATVPIGRPIANSTAYVLDAHLRPVPVGAHGALYVGGAGLARGYLNRPDLTAERFVPAPFGAEAGLAPGARLYATGDLARRLADGNIEFLGRVDQQVKIRGFRVEPGEIEAALAGHPAVREAVVLALADGTAGKRLVACLTPCGEAPAAADLRDHLRSRLPDYMIPSAFVWLESLPLTPNGKVDRAALARLEVAADLKAHVAPRTEAERAVAEVFREVFGLPEVGVHDDFFALGGHSLLATQVAVRVRRLCGVDLEIRVLFEEPTVEQLARRLELAGYGGGEPGAVPLAGGTGTSDHESPYSPPRTPLEELMAEIWGDVLGLDRVGLHDNFWSLGGRAPLAAEVLARAGDSFGIELPPQALHDAPTIAAFTAAIGEILLAEEAEDLEPDGLEPIGMGEV